MRWTHCSRPSFEGGRPARTCDEKAAFVAPGVVRFLIVMLVVVGLTFDAQAADGAGRPSWLDVLLGKEFKPGSAIRRSEVDLVGLKGDVTVGRPMHGSGTWVTVTSIAVGGPSCEVVFGRVRQALELRLGPSQSPLPILPTFGPSLKSLSATWMADGVHITAFCAEVPSGATADAPRRMSLRVARKYE